MSVFMKEESERKILHELYNLKIDYGKRFLFFFLLKSKIMYMKKILLNSTNDIYLNFSFLLGKSPGFPGMICGKISFS